MACIYYQMNAVKTLDLKLAVNLPANVGKDYFTPLGKALRYLGATG